jgi:hypothetical protein
MMQSCKQSFAWKTWGKDIRAEINPTPTPANYRNGMVT